MAYTTAPAVENAAQSSHHQAHAFSPETVETLGTLLQDGELIVQQVSGICRESIELLREECHLTVESAVVSSRWLAVAAVAAATCWLSINASAVALAIFMHMPWVYAALAVIVSNAAIACFAYNLAGRCVEDMRFSRIRSVLRGHP